MGLMKHKLGGKIMTAFVALRPKTYSYIADDSAAHLTKKKVKGTKKCVIKALNFNDYKGYLLSNEVILKSEEIFNSEASNMYTEEINKIALSSNNDKRLQTFDGIHTYPLGTNACKVYTSELDHHLKHEKLHYIFIEQVLRKFAKQSC